MDTANETLMVILGAGASHDSVPERFTPPGAEEFRPPLTFQLFDSRPHFQELVSNYEALRALVARLREDITGPSSDLESLLDKIHEEGSTTEHRRQQLLAFRFYLHDLIANTCGEWERRNHGTTNYARLVDELEHWRCQIREHRRIIYVTFNYDMLMEAALRSVYGCEWSDLGRYTSDPRFALIKPHGSVKWRQLAKIGLIREAPGLLIQQAARIKSYGAVEFSSASSHPLGVPAIAIPLLKKVELVCPDEHLVILDRALPDVTRLLVIGWQGRERLFNERLRDRLPRLASMLVVDKNQDASTAIAQRLEESWSLFKCRSRGVGGGFSFCFKEHLDGLLA